MAFRTEAQTVALVKANQVLWDLAEEFVTGPLYGAVQTCRDAIKPDGMELRGIEAAEELALTDVQRAAAGLSAAIRNYFRSATPEFGFLAGCADPTDQTLALASLADYFVTNSRKVVNRGLTKASSWTAGGSNIGDPTVFYADVDINGLTLDLSHAGTIVLECTQDQYNGAAEGNEEWTAFGSSVASYSWDEGGAGLNGGYKWTPGVGEKDFGFGQPFAVMGEPLRGASASQNNIIVNGDFEASFISGGTTDKVPSWVANASYANLSANTSTEIEGDRSLQCSATGAVIYQLLPSDIKTGCLYGYNGYVKTHSANAGTVTGNLTIVIKDDSTTHATLTVALGSVTLDTNTKFATGGKVFYLPTTVGANLRMEITFPSVGGTGTSPVVDIDAIGLIPLTILDGGRGVGVLNGLTAPRYRDRFTNVVSTADTGRVQYCWNRAFGRYLPHDGSGATWVDATRAPEIAISYNGSNVADGGTIALGSVGTGAHALTLTVTNTGNKTLTVLVPTHGTDSNIASVGVDYTVALVVPPYDTGTMVLTVTDGGAGAFSTIVDFTNNDADEGTFAITVGGTAV